MSTVTRVVTGVSTSWDLCTAVAGSTAETTHAVWSPCGRHIAACSDGGIEVRDSTTLEMLYDLKCPGSTTLERLYGPKCPDSTIFRMLHDFEYPDFRTQPPEFLAFSPDGQLLICMAMTRESVLLSSFISMPVFISQTNLRFGAIQIRQTRCLGHPDGCCRQGSLYKNLRPGWRR